MYTLLKEAEMLREKMFRANEAYPYIHKDYKDARQDLKSAIYDIFGDWRISYDMADQVLSMIENTGESVEWCIETTLSDVEKAVERAKENMKDEYEFPYYVGES